MDVVVGALQDAARLRDQIKELEELNQPQPPDMQGLTTNSDTVTDGIRVKVRRWVCTSCTHTHIHTRQHTHMQHIDERVDKSNSNSNSVPPYRAVQ